MKKTFKLEELDCAHCAAKMEESIKKIEGVTNANVNFIAQKLILEADDECFDEVLKETQRVCKSIEPDCTIVIDLP